MMQYRKKKNKNWRWVSIVLTENLVAEIILFDEVPEQLLIFAILVGNLGVYRQLAISTAAVL
jgi:hypothetical protein